MANYIPLVREAANIKLQNELAKARHKENVVPLQVHQELRKKFEALTIIEDETFANYKDE